MVIRPSSSASLPGAREPSARGQPVPDCRGGAVPAHRGRAVPDPRQRGTLTTELVVAIAIITLALIPLSFGLVQEGKLCQIYYHEAVAMEIVDGEMEILAAGEWRAFDEGSHNYAVRAQAAGNLPKGRFLLLRTNQLFRLEWRPDRPGNGRPISREWRAR